MSSFLSRSYLTRHRSTVHPILAVTTPFLFLLCLDALLRAVMPHIVFPPSPTLAALILVAVEVTAVGNILHDERAGVLARLRELIVVLALAYVALAVGRSVSARALVPVEAGFAYPLLLVLLQWVLTATIHANLRQREYLLAGLTGKEGETLLHALRDASLQASASLRSLRGVTLLVSVFQATVFVFLLALLAWRIPVGAAGLVLCGLHAVYGFFVVGLVNIFADDQLLLGEGIVVPSRLEAGRFASVALLIAGILPIAFLAARDSSLLPLSLLAELLSKIASIFPGSPNLEFMRQMQKLVESRLRYQQETLAASQGVSINPLVFILIEFGRRLVVSAAGAALYFFVVSPLLSEEFRKSVAKRSLIAFLTRKLKGFLHFCRRAIISIAIWWGRFRTGNRSRDDSRKAAPSAERGRPAPHGSSVRKRLQVGRVLRTFLLLVRWAEVRGIGHQGFEAPKEYSFRLLALVPDKAGELSLVVEVLEEVLFSSHLVHRHRVAGYYSAIRDIRRSA